MLDLDEAANDYRAFDRDLARRGHVWITSQDDYARIRAVCEGWIREYRPQLVRVLGEVDSILAIDAEVSWLRSRVGMRTRADDVRAAARRIQRAISRDLLPAYDVARWSTATAVTQTDAGDVARRLALVSEQVADSYRQASTDLADESRSTYVGPAGELREVLRSTIDALAPPADEIATEAWYKGHNGRPTQAEKIRAILGDQDRATQPAKSLDVIDEAIGAVGRATYNRASASLHVARKSAREEVTRIKMWVDVVLSEVLPDA